MPVNIQLASTLNKPQSYEFEMVQDPFLTPVLMNLGMVSALTSTERMVGPSTFQIQGGIELSSGGQVDVDDVVSADANAGAMAGGAVAIPLAFLLGSGFPDLAIKSIHLSVVALNQRRVANRSRQPLPEDVAATEAGPDEQALSHEAMQMLARAVGRLPNEFRAALLLRIEEGLSFREIADVLETTEQTARWRVFKARQKLLTVLAPQLDREKP